jgi:ribosomal protein L37E
MKLNRKEVADKLNSKGATLPCHRCGRKEFTVLEGFSSISLQNDLSGGLVIGGPAVPVVHIVCNNCGALTPHALGALDMLPQEEAKNDE